MDRPSGTQPASMDALPKNEQLHADSRLAAIGEALAEAAKRRDIATREFASRAGSRACAAKLPTQMPPSRPPLVENPSSLMTSNEDNIAAGAKSDAGPYSGLTTVEQDTIGAINDKENDSSGCLPVPNAGSGKADSGDESFESMLEELEGLGLSERREPGPKIPSKGEDERLNSMLEELEGLGLTERQEPGPKTPGKGKDEEADGFETLVHEFEKLLASTTKLPPYSYTTIGSTLKRIQEVRERRSECAQLHEKVLTYHTQPLTAKAQVEGGWTTSLMLERLEAEKNRLGEMILLEEPLATGPTLERKRGKESWQKDSDTMAQPDVAPKYEPENPKEVLYLDPLAELETSSSTGPTLERKRGKESWQKDSDTMAQPDVAPKYEPENPKEVLYLDPLAELETSSSTGPTLERKRGKESWQKDSDTMAQPDVAPKYDLETPKEVPCLDPLAELEAAGIDTAALQGWSTYLFSKGASGHEAMREEYNLIREANEELDSTIKRVLEDNCRLIVSNIAADADEDELASALSEFKHAILKIEFVKRDPFSRTQTAIVGMLDRHAAKLASVTRIRIYGMSVKIELDE